MRLGYDVVFGEGVETSHGRQRLIFAWVPRAIEYTEYLIEYAFASTYPCLRG